VDPVEDRILPDPYPPNHDFYRPYTLVLELDKSLVYSSWDKDHGWKTAKRPYLDYFLSYLAQYYELVIFTSQTPMV
jgi:import inner membrane translocase subunit TIM50